MFFTYPVSVFAENIDPLNIGSQYAWGENVGWINFEPSQGPGVTVTDTAVTGMVWGENIGWINLSPTNYGGVVNDGVGILSGYAWGENIGWIKFNPSGGGVFIDACGDFNGMAWGENIGWISFRSDGANPFYLRTSWVSPVDKVPPVTDPASPILDWYNTTAQITLAATDCGTGTKEVHYELDGVPVTLQGSTAVVDVLTEGEHTLSFYSVDQVGNIEASNQVTIRVDKTPPNINIITPANLVTYNINQSLAVNYSVIDNLSGVQSVTPTIPYGQAIDTSKIGAYSFTVSATDNAANASTVTHNYSIAYPGNIDPDNTGCQYAWAENVGWVNFKPSWGPGITVTDTGVTGKAWGENIGWINLSPTNGGVVNNGSGSLSGYAWAENVGWINFGPTGEGVSIDPTTGLFSGKAWGENVGWISFSSTGTVPFCIKTSWRPPPPNQPPVANNQVVSTDEDIPINITLTATDPENDSLIFSVVTFPLHGTLSGTAPNLTYSPSLNYNGPDSITFKANDGKADSNIATVSITVTPVNDAPVANGQVVTTNQNTAVNITLTAMDVDGDSLTFITVSQPGHGTLTGTPPNVVYNPALNYNGSDFFTFKVNDGTSDSNIATVSITVNPVVPPAYTFYGFFSPVDNLPIVNNAKAGQTIPVKWRITDINGVSISDPASFVSLGSYQITCENLSGDPTSAVEEYSAGSSGLQYSGDGYWQFNWKTPKTYAGQCRTMVLSLGDGSTHTAHFKFK